MRQKVEIYSSRIIQIVYLLWGSDEKKIIETLVKFEYINSHSISGPSKTNLGLKRSNSKISRRHRSVPPETVTSHDDIDLTQSLITGKKTLYCQYIPCCVIYTINRYFQVIFLHYYISLTTNSTTKAGILNGPIPSILVELSFYIKNQKPVMPSTDFHCLTTWAAHSSW